MSDLISYTALNKELSSRGRIFELNQKILKDGVFKFDPNSSHKDLMDYYDDAKCLCYIFEYGAIYFHINSLHVFWDFDWYNFLQSQEDIFHLIGVHRYLNVLLNEIDSSEIFLFRNNSRVSMMLVEELSFDRKLTLKKLKKLNNPLDIWKVNVSNLDDEIAYFVL